MKNKKMLYIIILLSVFINCLSITPLEAKYIDNAVFPMSRNSYNILVDLTEQRLYIIDTRANSIVKSYPVAGGKPSTPSPFGTWTIVSKASEWGEGFGSRWMGLNVPWGKFGIHGTNKPCSIGGAASHGCIRMFNKDVEDLYKYVNYGTTVVIYGGPYGMYPNGFRPLMPGDRGSDVFEVQRKMKNIGYYPGSLDGIYGEGMKKYVIKFRKDKRLSTTHNIDRAFYNALDMRPFE